MKVPYLKTIVAVGLLCAGAALADGPGFGPGYCVQGAGFGPRMMGGRGMGYGPGRMGGDYGPAALDLTDEQRDRISAVREEQRREMLRSHEETRRKLESILTPEQRKQFRGFGPRWAG